MFDKIVVPLDGSPGAEQILHQVRRLLRRVDAELILARTENPAILGVPSAVFGVAVGEARSYLWGLADQLGAEGIRVRTKVEVGPAAQEIVRLVREEQASLVALTTRGRTGTPRLLLGSVAEEILRTSSVPVLVLRVQPTPADVEPGEPLRKVLVPLDGSERALQAFGPAAELCRLFQARLLFLRVLEKIDYEERNRARAAMEEVEERSRAMGIDTLSFVAEGDPAERILDFARFHKADLIAMATHGRRGLARLLTGSVTEEVLRKSTLPVLVVPSKEILEARDRNRLEKSRA